MTEVQNIINSIREVFNEEQIKEILDDNGDLRSNIDIVDSQTNEVIASANPNAVEWKTPAEIDYAKKPEEEKEKEFRGDYCEMREVMRINNRYDMVEHLRKVDRRRIVLIREHLLQLLAYETQYAKFATEIINIITRLMMGDIETDFEMPNTDFDIGENSVDSDEEEEPSSSNSDYSTQDERQK